MTSISSSDPLLRPTIMQVDLDALEHNFRVVRERVAPAKIMAVVKANAYGHGLLTCARHFVELGADYLGVALVEEGIALRRAGIRTPILVFGGILGAQVKLYLDFALDITASSVEKVRLIEATAKELHTRARVHVKIDTGMRRIGIRPESVPGLFEELGRCEHIELAGIFSHFACSEDPEKGVTEEQFRAFTECIARVPLKDRPLRHIANSGAIIQHPGTFLDMVRPGIALYGVCPSSNLEGALNLRPAMSLRSRVVFFKVVRAGEGVSYGHSWKAERNTRIVTLPVGYGDGYPRALSNRGSVLIRGRRYPIVGKICMDQMMIAVGDGEAYNGDEAVLIGEQGRERITVTEIAENAGTVTHEILTATNLRVPRLFLRHGAQYDSVE